MPKEYFPYFSFNAKLDFEKKTYQLLVTIFYNKKAGRREFEVKCDQFPGPVKLLVYQLKPGDFEKEWFDINNQDNSLLVQELGSLINRQNI
jgi:hypothetical protein